MNESKLEHVHFGFLDLQLNYFIVSFVEIRAFKTLPATSMWMVSLAAMLLRSSRNGPPL